MELRLQGSRVKKNATVTEVVRAVRALARPNGPTYVIVEAGNGDDAIATIAPRGHSNA